MSKYILPIIVFLITACSSVPSTFDPNLSGIQAEHEAELFHAMATGTAQAQVLPITQTAAVAQFASEQTQEALVIAQAQAAATSTAGIATQSAFSTAQVGTQIAAATTTSQAATQTVEQYNFAQQQDQDADARQRRKWLNGFYASVPVLGFLLIVIAGAYAVIVYSRSVRMKVIERDEDGKPKPVYDTVTHRYTDLSVHPNHSDVQMGILMQLFVQFLEQKFGFVPEQPHNTAARQDGMRFRDQNIQLARISKGHLLAPPITTDIIPIDLPVPGSVSLEPFSLPDWSQMLTYPFKQGEEFPYASFANGLARIDMNKTSHVGIVGPTGSGKSRRLLRPFIASALCSGFRVVMLGDVVDFMVFKMHKNASVVPIFSISKPEDAELYVTALRTINDEMEVRNRWLAENNFSTWERSGGELTIVVLDEIGANLDILYEINKPVARALRGYLILLIKKGRKSGFFFVFTSQRAVGLKDQLSQVATMLFRVKDKDEERFALGSSGYGAPLLQDDYFLSKVDFTIEMAGAFMPDDLQIGELLLRHETKALPKPEWVSMMPAWSSIVKPLPVQNKVIEVVTQPVITMEPELNDEDEASRILSLKGEGMSNTNIVYALWGTSGPKFEEHMKRVKEVLAATATANEQKVLKTNDLGQQ